MRATQDTTPEPLWREVVGDTEPWRRGRLFLVCLAIWQVLSQTLALGLLVLLGNIEGLLLMIAGATVSWLLFYFIWIGVHWVRWLSAGVAGLVGFAKLIWGVRDGNAFHLIDGTIGFAVAAYLGLAPSVYFFALRQKERMHWKEALVVAGIFAVLLASLGTGLGALFGQKARLEAEGRVFADRAFRALFIDGDTEFLKKHATARLMRESGWDRLSRFMADRYMRAGDVRNLRPAQGRMQFWFQFPAAIVGAGAMSAEGEAAGGPIQFHVRIGRAAGEEWEIDAVWWRYAASR